MWGMSNQYVPLAWYDSISAPHAQPNCLLTVFRAVSVLTAIMPCLLYEQFAAINTRAMLFYDHCGDGVGNADGDTSPEFSILR